MVWWRFTWLWNWSLAPPLLVLYWFAFRYQELLFEIFLYLFHSISLLPIVTINLLTRSIFISLSIHYKSHKISLQSTQHPPHIFGLQNPKNPSFPLQSLCNPSKRPSQIFRLHCLSMKWSQNTLVCTKFSLWIKVFFISK